jgi:hypothetical protein
VATPERAWSLVARAAAAAATAALIVWAVFKALPRGLSSSFLIASSAATWSQLLPLFAMPPGRLPAARKLILLWCVVFFVSDFAQVALTKLVGNNLVFMSISIPLEDAILLFALSHWQTRPVFQLAFRLGAPLLFATSIAIAVFVGEFATYNEFAGPFRSLVVLAATLFTIVDRSRIETRPLAQCDWLWISIGVALYYSAMVAIAPMMKLASPQGLDAIARVFIFRAVADVIAFTIIAKGIRCPIPADSSGPT